METQISTVHYKHQLYRMITMFRGAVVGLIYNRTLVLQSDVWDESSAVTLMSTDVDRIADTVGDVHETWARLIEVAIGIWLLARQLGWVCVVPIIVVLCKSRMIKLEAYLVLVNLLIAYFRLCRGEQPSGELDRW